MEYDDAVVVAEVEHTNEEGADDSKHEELFANVLALDLSLEHEKIFAYNFALHLCFHPIDQLPESLLP